MPLQLVTPRQASKLVGVSESTVRRWCDSGELEVSKTSGGHRRIEVNALLRFARSQGLAVVSMGPAVTAGLGGRLPRSKELARRFYELLTAAEIDDNAGEFAQNLVSERGEIETLCDEVIAPVLHRIGEEWSAGSLRIHQEHIATQESLAALLAAHSHFPTKSAQHVAVCGALSGDPYSIAPAMCSLALRSAEFRTVQLGPNLPAEEIILAAIEQKAALIAVSVGVPPSSADELLELCAGAEKAGIRLALGGRGLDVEVRKQLTPDFFGDNMAHLVAYAKRLQESLRDTSSAIAGRE